MTLAPEDPRHGILAGYGAGCREKCCRDAKNRYEEIRVHARLLGQPPRTVPSIGTHRRIHALMALGWTAQHIADQAGWGNARNVTGLLLQATVKTATAKRVDDVYDILSMKLGPSNSNRKRSAAKGWPVPLAWDEGVIDDPDGKPYQPRTKGASPEPLEVDPVIVERALQGKRVRANYAERVEIVRLWLDSGRTPTALENLQGWNVRSILRRAAA